MIDAFGDYLAMAGHTEDFSLSGLPNDVYWNPFAVLASISIPDYYYWAKVFSHLGFCYFTGLQFSTDGSLLISVLNCNNEFKEVVVTMQVSSGVVLSAATRPDSYSYNGFESIVVSSKTDPIGFMLLDTINHDATFLIKFDPLKITSDPSWLLQSERKSGDPVDHYKLGLVFGREESFIYAF